MADITVTAGSVLPGTDARIVEGTSGATITAGQSVYRDSADSNKFKLADGNDTAAKAAVYGIALNDASAGQPIDVQRSGSITPGATLALGNVYIQSTTPGGICPVQDYINTNATVTTYMTVIGVATSTAVMKVNITQSGVVAVQ